MKQKSRNKALKESGLVKDFMLKYSGPESFEGLFKEFKKAIIETVLKGELEEHLGYEKHAKSVGNNARNGSYDKRVVTDTGAVEIDVPRDREASFEPQLIKKGQTKFLGFDDKIISMYGRGMTIKEIQGHLMDMYDTEVSHDFISRVTDSIVDEVTAWQNRPLDDVYPILYMDAIQLKVRENGQIVNKALYLAIGVNIEGHKEVLGMWIAKNEGAKFWLGIMTEIKNRGVESIYITCIDGLKGFPEAIRAVFPNTMVQLCIVHMLRYSLNFVPWKDKRDVAQDLKAIYTAKTEADAVFALDIFKKKWDSKYPSISRSWEANWQGIIPFLQFPKEIRKAIYTTNAIEAINRQIRKVTKPKSCFPNDMAVFKVVYLALQNAQKSWTIPIRDWKMALNQFTILFS